MRLIVETDNLETLLEALESIPSLINDGYLGGTTNNGCFWDIEGSAKGEENE